MRRKISAFMASLLILAGCAAPDAKVRSIAVSSDAIGLGSVDAPILSQDWWTALGDPQLNRIIATALTDSPRLDLALSRVREAQAVLASRRADALPRLSGDANEQYGRLSEDYIIPPPFAGSMRWLGQAQANLGWNLDLWGQRADAIKAAGASARAIALDHEAARQALVGAIVQTYVEYSRAERQIALAKAHTEQRDHALKLIRTRIRSNLSSKLDERASETLLAQAQQIRVRAEGQRTLLVHALALLAGKGADYYATITPSQLKLDSALPLPAALPADLLARRPDVMAAKARIEAAAAGRSVARKAFYPNINLSAFLGTQAVGLGNLFSSDAGTYGGGAAIHLPIFEGGKLRADQEAATARLDGAIAGYNNIVIDAVRETADALSQVENMRADLEQQRRVTNGLEEVVRLNRIRVSTGLNSRLDLIGTDIRLLEAQQDQANVEAQLALSAIKLVVAIGGGFSEPTEKIAATADIIGTKQ